MVSLLRTGRRGVKAAPFSLGNCLKLGFTGFIGFIGLGGTRRIWEGAVSRKLPDFKDFCVGFGQENGGMGIRV